LKHHFGKDLNQGLPPSEAVIINSEEMLDKDISEPLEEEVKRATKSLKNGNTPGFDQVYAELLKAEDAVTPKLLTELLQRNRIGTI
jgi:hypothetical protein